MTSNIFLSQVNLIKPNTTLRNDFSAASGTLTNFDGKIRSVGIKTYIVK